MAEDEARTAGSGANAAADAIALGAQGRLDPRAAAYLEEQTRLAKLQSQNLIEQNEFELSHLRFRRFSDYARFALEIAAGLVMLLILCGLGTMVWNAAHDSGLVIESFSVPPDLASRGLTGQVVAGQLLDDLSAMEAQPSSTPSQSYRNDWGSDVKIEIPDTGISIGELDRYLRSSLGHETRISGALYRGADGLVVSARTGSGSASTFAGSEKDLPRLVHNLAERVFATTQPMRYVEYLSGNGRYREELPLLRGLLNSSSPEKRADVFTMLGIAELYGWGDLSRARATLQKAISLDPRHFAGLGPLESIEVFAGHDQQAFEAYRKQLIALQHGYGEGATDLSRRLWIAIGQASMDEILGDYRSAIPYWHKAAQDQDWSGSQGTAISGEASDEALDHDPAAARSALSQSETSGDSDLIEADIDWGYFALPNYFIDRARGDWQAARADAASADRALTKPGGWLDHTSLFGRNAWVWPWLALAEAKTGDPKAAHALIDKTPSDCYLCLRVRGMIDATQQRWSSADYWFARAVQRAPLLPFAYSEWGEMLLREGKYDEAIANFRAANKAGPHFANPLEMWGEAFIAKNRSDLALAKFAEAEKYAPNWGRLHLKWGEALLWSGDKTGAKKQFAAAAALDLTAAQRHELGVMRGSAPINGKIRT